MRTLLLALAVGIGLTTLANICTTVYLHRGLSHRAVTFSRPAHAGFKLLVWLTTGINVVGFWTSVLGGIVISLVSWALSIFLPDDDRRTPPVNRW